MNQQSSQTKEMALLPLMEPIQTKELSGTIL
jgi:hypothetical protein